MAEDESPNLETKQNKQIEPCSAFLFCSGFQWIRANFWGWLFFAEGILGSVQHNYLVLFQMMIKSEAFVVGSAFCYLSYLFILSLFPNLCGSVLLILGSH